MKCNAIELIERKKYRSIPSFDVGGGNIDFIRASFEAAEDEGQSMFLSSTPSTIKSYLGFNNYTKIIELVARDYSIDYAIHLDHSTTLEETFLAIEAGFSSVMYDGSHEPIDVNIKNTKLVITKAHEMGATVEAELGVIGGKEDDLEVDGPCLPKVSEIVRFLSETKVHMLAPAVGTVHGNFQGDPKIDWDLINDFIGLDGNFVLHGCTGLDGEILRKASDLGFVKFNFATSLREVFRRNLELFFKNDEALKPYVYLNSSRKALTFFMKDIFNNFKND